MTKIEVLSGIPGAGKTQKILEECEEKDGKKVFLGHSHQFLKDLESRINCEYRIWKGMEKMCPLKGEDELITNLINSSISPSWVCSLCQDIKMKGGTCRYQEQFKNNPDLILAPHSYLYTRYVGNENPDSVYIDDITYDLNQMPTRLEVKNFLHFINKRGWFPSLKLEDLIDEVETNDEFIPEISEELKGYFLNNPDSYEGLEKLISPLALKEWSFLSQKYGVQNVPDLPLVFYAFDMAKEEDAKVTISEARPNMRLLEGLAQRYEDEERGEIEYNKTDIEDMNGFERNQNSKIFRVVSKHKRNAWYPCGSVAKSEKQQKTIKERITNIIRKENESKVGLITKKDIKPSNLIPEDVESVNLTFGDLRGQNPMRNLNLLFVVGTYVENLTQTEKDFFNYYAREPKTTEAEKLDEGGYRYKDNELENFKRIYGTYEAYQGIHRIRPAVSESKVFIFGKIPDIIKEEFENIHKIFVEKDEERVEYTEVTPPKIIVRRELLQKRKISKSEVANILARDHPTISNKGWAYRNIEKVIENQKDITIAKEKSGKRGRPKQYIKLK